MREAQLLIAALCHMVIVVRSAEQAFARRAGVSKLLQWLQLLSRGTAAASAVGGRSSMCSACLPCRRYCQLLVESETPTATSHCSATLMLLHCCFFYPGRRYSQVVVESEMISYYDVSGARCCSPGCRCRHSPVCCCFVRLPTIVRPLHPGCRAPHARPHYSCPSSAVPCQGCSSHAPCAAWFGLLMPPLHPSRQGCTSCARPHSLIRQPLTHHPPHHHTLRCRLLHPAPLLVCHLG